MDVEGQRDKSVEERDSNERKRPLTWIDVFALISLRWRHVAANLFATFSPRVAQSSVRVGTRCYVTRLMKISSRDDRFSL